MSSKERAPALARPRGMRDGDRHVRREMDLRERLRGVLLGTAVGDALGLATEGMSGASIAPF